MKAWWLLSPAVEFLKTQPARCFLWTSSTGKRVLAHNAPTMLPKDWARMYRRPLAGVYSPDNTAQRVTVGLICASLGGLEARTKIPNIRKWKKALPTVGLLKCMWLPMEMMMLPKTKKPMNTISIKEARHTCRFVGTKDVIDGTTNRTRI